MAKDTKDGLKSSFDLAMERMAQRGERMTELSAEQKRDLADLSARTKAKLAEIEILFGKSLTEAQASGDAAKVAKVEEDLQTAKAKVKRQDDEERQKIRGG